MSRRSCDGNQTSVAPHELVWQSTVILADSEAEEGVTTIISQTTERRTILLHMLQVLRKTRRQIKTAQQPHGLFGSFSGKHPLPASTSKSFVGRNRIRVLRQLSHQTIEFTEPKERSQTTSVPATTTVRKLIVNGNTLYELSYEYSRKVNKNMKIVFYIQQ